MGLEIFSLEGKVALVTGASRGLGRTIALGFAEAGADVAVAARTEADLESLAGEIESLGRRAVTIPTDVTARDAIESMIGRTTETLGSLDVLVNNAGGARFMSPLLGLRPEGWDRTLNLNLNSVFHATQVAASVMVDSGRGGSIIQMASVSGMMGAPTLSFYAAAKGAVRLFTQSIAEELATAGVRVNCIAPGWIDTPLNEWATTNESALATLTRMIPMGRFGRPSEVLGAALLLASDAGSFMTGTTIVVDGGQTA